jgi:hypothetical protein
MHCTNCGSEITGLKFCGQCGTAAPTSIPEFELRAVPAEKKSNKFWTSWSTNRRTFFVIWMALILLAGLNGQNVFSFLGGLVSGEVTLDTAKVEGVIESGILDQSGEAVTASCPNLMSGKVGDIRKCTVVDSTGATYVVDITIQSRQGDILWQVEN